MSGMARFSFALQPPKDCVFNGQAVAELVGRETTITGAPAPIPARIVDAVLLLSVRTSA